MTKYMVLFMLSGLLIVGLSETWAGQTRDLSCFDAQQLVAIEDAATDLALAVFDGVVLPDLTADGSKAEGTSYHCCDAGENPLNGTCRKLLFGAAGVCLRVTWKCTSSDTSTGCTQQLAGSDSFVSK